MADVKWIKITTDMFDNRKIKHLRRLPDGNNIVLIWVMLLTMAGRCNASGMIFLTENIPYTPKMIADELDFEESTVLLALEALERFDMVICNEGVLTIAGWEEHQNIDGLDKIREQNRIRQAKFKEKQKLLSGNVTDNVTDNVTVTDGNATDIDIELDKDIKKKNKEKPYEIVVGYLNEKAGTTYRASSKATQSHINARLSEGYTVDDFKIVIDKQCTKWKGTEYEQYLRPSTLFGTKFENYLNGKTTTTSDKNAGWCFTPNEDSLDDVF